MTDTPIPLTDAEIVLFERYKAAMHAVQTAIRLEIETKGEQGAGATPKHLRLGINSALVDSGALARLLMQKGIITREEHLEMLAKVAEEEVKIYEARFPGVKFA